MPKFVKSMSLKMRLFVLFGVVVVVVIVSIGVPLVFWQGGIGVEGAKGKAEGQKSQSTSREVKAEEIKTSGGTEEDIVMAGKGLVGIAVRNNVVVQAGDSSQARKSMLRVAPSLKIEPRYSQGSLPIKSINLDDGVIIETSIHPEPEHWTEQEILEYADSHSLEQTELWLAGEIEEYLAGYCDVSVEMHSLEPLKLTPVITKRSVNKYEEEIMD